MNIKEADVKMLSQNPKIDRRLKSHKTIILCPTFSCNCRCWYCYEDHRAVAMSDVTVESIERYIQQQAALCYDWLWLDFFGGEPLLFLDDIIRLADSARQSCISHGVRFMSGMTTNGVLLNKDTWPMLEEAGIKHLQITLDGAPDFHNAQRPLASGKETWSSIWNGLMCLKNSESEFQCIIRIHYQVSRLHEAIQLVEKYINPTFSKDRRFSINFHELVALGGPNDAYIEQKSLLDKSDALQRLKESLEHPDMIVPIDTENYICYASDPNSIVISPDGSLSKCTVIFDKVGELKSDGKADINLEKISRWSNSALGEDGMQPKCPNVLLKKSL